MILPRRTVCKPAWMHGGYELSVEEGKAYWIRDNEVAATLETTTGTEFGMERPCLLFSGSLEGGAFESLAYELVCQFEQKPCRWPLYIRLHPDDLELIARASKTGFQPYFGQWELANEEQSWKAWEQITEDLRNAYPAGLRAA